MDDMASVGLHVDSREVRTASGDLEKFAGAGERTQKRTASAMKLIGSALAALGAVSWASGGIREARAYGAAMSEVSTLIEGTPALMKEIEAATRGASRQFGTSAQAQAKAYYQAVSGGAKAGAEATELLNTANKLAIAGVTDVASAVGILTSATNVYADSGLTAAEASDALFVAVRAGVTTIPELSASLGKVLPLAQKLGLRFDDVAAATAALTKGGINTAESVTGINAALTAVIGPTKAATDLAESLGLEFNSAALESKGFAGFMADVVEATGGSADQMRELFGSTEATKVALALAGTAGQDMANILEDMGNKAGETETAFTKMSRDMDQRLKVVGSRFADLQLSVGQALLTVLVPVMEKAADAAEFFANAIPTEKIAAAAEALMKWEGLDELATGLGIVGVALAALTFPFLAVGVAASVAAAYLFSNWDGLRTKFPGITGALIGAVEMAKSAWNGIAGAFVQLAPAFSHASDAVAQVIAGNWAGAWVSAKASVQVFYDWWVGLSWPALDWQALVPQAFTDALDRFTLSIDPIKQSLTDTWAQVGPILENFKVVGQELYALFANSAANESNVFGEIAKFVGFVAGGATQVAALALEGLARALETLTGVIAGLLTGDIARVKTELFEFFDWMTGGFLTSITDAVSRIGPAISSAAGEVTAAIQAIWAAISTEIATWPAKMVQLGKDIIDGMITGVKSKANELIASIMSVVNKLPASVRKFLRIASPSKVFAEIGRHTIDGMIVGIQDKTGEMVDEIRSTAGQVVQTAEQTLQQGFGQMVDYMLDGMKGGMKGLIDIFKNTLKQMVSMAIKNKIMIGVSMSESVAGGVANAAGGGGGPLGGLGGGGGLLSGLLGSFGGGGGMAGLAGGAGFLGGVGNVVGGFASGGFAGGFGAIGTALSGATAGLGGIAMAAGALALPLLAVTAAFSFFKKKTKELDSGLRVTVRGVDALVQTFSVIQTKRFWGLSKKVRTSFQNASDEIANPLIKAIGEMQGGIVGGAAMLGIASEAFDNFTHTLQVSTKGMSDADAQKAVMDAFEGMGNAFANMIPGLQALQKDGEGAMAALNRLVASLAAVNDAFDILGKSLYSASLSGADLASTMVDAFGGLDAMTQAVGAYWQGFYTEEEKLATSTRRLTEEMAGLGFTLPASRDAFRALVEGIDTSTHEGAALYAGLLKLSGAFFEITTVTEASAKAISDAARATAKAISGMVEGILGNLDLMPTSRAQNAARNSLQVNETKAMQAAADGDTTAVQGYLTEARAASSSDLAYREISARVLAQLSGGLPSFAGGGYTGGGSRSGGMDGQGGFLSMMHPQEKVTDMSRGGGAGSDELLAEIKALRAENLQLGMRADTHQRSTANTLEKWDKVGTPVVPFTGAGQW